MSIKASDKWARDLAQWFRCLPRKCKVPSSIPDTKKEKSHKYLLSSDLSTLFGNRRRYLGKNCFGCVYYGDG